MNLRDIAPLEKWIELEKDIHQRTGLDVNVFDIKGYRISDFKNWANKLCPEIKATDKGQSFICAPAHMNIAAMAMKARKTVIEECDAGLVKMVVPIFYGEDFVGAIGACGFLLDDGEVDSFLVNKMTEIDEDRVEKLAVGMPSITTAKAESLGQYIAKQVESILGESGPSANVG
jgi:ligand-binding sensor protein